MPRPEDHDPTWRELATPDGLVHARLVDDWMAVTPGGDILLRDVWEVRPAGESAAPSRRVLTFPDPDDAQLLAACMAR